MTDIVYILEELNFGGTQRQTLELAARLDRSRFRPVIWTLCGGTPDLLTWAHERGITVQALTTHARFRPEAALPALWRRLGSGPPPLIHLCTALPNIWGRILGSLRRAPRILASCRSGTAIRNQHERFLWRLAHAHVCNTSPLRDALIRDIGVPASQVTCIPNGVDTQFFCPAPAPAQSPEIVCVGRMVPDKDHATLLDAFARVLLVEPQARLRLVGDGPLADAVRERAGKGDCGGRVLLHPGSSDLRPMLHQARVFALASVSEGLPNVLLEAMSCALPVVATRVGGVPDLVSHEQNGLLVPPRDPAALAAALVRLLGDPGACADMGASGRAHVLRHHGYENMVTRHEDVYASLMERHS